LHKLLPCFKDSIHSGMVVEHAPLHAKHLQLLHGKYACY